MTKEIDIKPVLEALCGLTSDPAIDDAIIIIAALAGRYRKIMEEVDKLQWQPIESAPKDGTEILVKDGVGGVHGAKWNTVNGTEGWFHHRNQGWLPSACEWMPLP